MSRSTHFLAILPLLAVMGLSPMKIQTHGHKHTQNRSIASDVTYPKLTKEIEKIDRSKIENVPGLDAGGLNVNIMELRNSVQEQEKDHKKVFASKEESVEQGEKVLALVKRFVEVEEQLKVIKTIHEGDDELYKSEMGKMSAILETLLPDEVKVAEEVKKEEVKEEPKEEIKEVVKEEEAKKPETTKPEEHVCSHSESNSQISKQFADLLEQQNKIIANMSQMNTMMLQMQQQQQQQRTSEPNWYILAAMMNRASTFPTFPTSSAGGSWVYVPQQQQQPLQLQVPQVQNLMPQLVMPQQQQQPQVEQPYYQNYQLPAPMYQVGSFGASGNSFVF